MLQVIVKLFARARDVAGTGEVLVPLASGATVADLRIALAREVPALAPLCPRLFVAMGEAYASEHDQIRENISVACFPPVSGG